MKGKKTQDARKRNGATLLLLFALFYMGACATKPKTGYQSSRSSALPSWASISNTNGEQLAPLPASTGPSRLLPQGATSKLRFGTRGSSAPDWGNPIEPSRPHSRQPLPTTPPVAPVPPSRTRPAPGGTTGPTVIIQNSPVPSTEAPPSPQVTRPNLSRIESLYNRIPQLTRGKAVEQFGYEAIRKVESSGNVASVPDAYILGPGDELLLRSSGGFTLDQTVTIDREGRVFLPQIGAISLSGKSLGELNPVLTEVLKNEYKDFNLSATLKRLRTLSLTITGNVERPGNVSVPANTSVLQLLATVGGIQKDGSLRNIVWRSRNSPPRRLDLYGLLLSGDASQLGQIAEGDQLHVPAIGPTAAVTGPGGDGIFELIQGDSLAQLIHNAGAENAFADSSSAQFERADSSGRRTLTPLSPTALASAAQDADVLALAEVLDISNNPVTLEGAILRPGTAAFIPGMRITDLLHQGQGFTMDASTRRAMLYRLTGPETTYDQTPGDASGRSREQLIWIDLEAILSNEGPSNPANIALQAHDRLRILTRDALAAQPTVTIAGAVRKPGTYRLTAGLSLGDLIALAGGPSADAFRGASLLVRRTRADNDRHSNVDSFSFSLAQVLARESIADTPLANYDHILIRRVQPGQIEATINGRVQFPGTYTLPRDARITDLVAQAGGLLPDANLRAAVFRRERVRQQQAARLTDMLTRSEERFARARDLNTRDGSAGESLAGQLSLMGLRNRAGNMNRVQATGRIVLDFQAPDFPVSPQNLTLESGDRFFIPGDLSTVTVIGRVFSPNAFLHQDGFSVADYLDKAGGMLDDADKKQAYVILASGEVVSAAQRGGTRGWSKFVPGPGDTILVPPKPVERTALSKAGDGLALVRDMAELGLIGSAIPASGGTATSIPLDIGRQRQNTQPVPSVPFDAVLQNEAPPIP